MPPTKETLELIATVVGAAMGGSFLFSMIVKRQIARVIEAADRIEVIFAQYNDLDKEVKSIRARVDSDHDLLNGLKATHDYIQSTGGGSRCAPAQPAK